MTEESKALLEKAEKAKILYNLGHIDRMEARSSIQPYIDFFNQRTQEIAKKYGMKPKTISFTTFVR